MACSHLADTTGSVCGTAWTTPDAALAAAASETADDVALKHAAIPNRVIDGDSDSPHPTSEVGGDALERLVHHSAPTAMT